MKPLEIEGLNTLRAHITHHVDPTNVPIEFGITAPTATIEPSTWVAGAWESSWNSATGVAFATTPSIGGSAAGADLEVEAATEYLLWARFNPALNDYPVLRCGVFPTA